MPTDELVAVKRMDDTDRLLARNEAQQHRARRRLEKAGGPLKRQKRSEAQIRPKPEDVWRVPGLNDRVRVEVRSAENGNDDWAAKGVARALESCGFLTKISADTDRPWEGVHVESQTINAEVAVLIHSAFRSAGVSASLTIHDRVTPDRVVVHLGTRGLN